MTILKEVFGVWAFVWRRRHTLSTSVCIYSTHLHRKLCLWSSEAPSSILQEYVIFTKCLRCNTTHLSVSCPWRSCSWFLVIDCLLSLSLYCLSGGRRSCIDPCMDGEPHRHLGEPRADQREADSQHSWLYPVFPFIYSALLSRSA